MPDSSFLPIGRIRKAHGIRGEVSVDYYADSPELLQEGVYLRQPGKSAVFHDVASYRAHHGGLLIRFKSVMDRNIAESLRGSDILVPGDRLPAPDDGSIYLHEILGLRVFATDEKGRESDWGIIAGIADYAGQETWTISKENENDILFPAAPALILGFDLDARLVRVAPPPGLFDLYRSPLQQSPDNSK
ncbi:MAG: ribosome maturation factor RimM [Deltaproteobacteria bacterium]|nr:ribosome maturation factor RimM [Deltaproteobacteria bacterium]